MLLELYGMEETARLRQHTIQHDIELYRLKSQPGFLRLFFGSMLVRTGEWLRGTSERRTAEATPVVATSC